MTESQVIRSTQKQIELEGFLTQHEYKFISINMEQKFL